MSLVKMIHAPERSTRHRILGMCLAVLVCIGVGLSLTGCTTGESLPKGFPLAPQVADGMITGSSATANSWQVSIELDDSESYQSVLEKLTNAGFILIGQSESGTGREYSLASQDYSVRLVLDDHVNNKSAEYSVAKRNSGS